MIRKVDVAVIGGGTAGISAVSQVRKATDNFVLINGGPLGTTCARVGCMPSKVMIHIANDYHRRHALAQTPLEAAAELYVDDGQAMARVRSLRDGFVKGTVEGFIKPLGDKFVDGYAEFIEPTLLKIHETHIRADHIIIATGTRPIIPEPWASFKEQILTTDNVFEQPNLPKRIGVIGLGVNVTGFDTLEQIAGLENPDVNQSAVEIFAGEFPIHLAAKAQIEQHHDELLITAGQARAMVDKVLVSVGRTPNVERLRLDRLGVRLDDKGLPPFSPETMQVADLPMFIAGDVNGYRPILHEAVHEGKIAGYNATHKPITPFTRKTPLSIAFCEPNICSVGATWNNIKDGNPAVGAAAFKSGRARILQQEHGIIKVYADRDSGRLLGADMVAPQGEHLGHLLAWSIQNRQTVFDLLQLPFYHPTIEETLQNAFKDLLSHFEYKEPII